MDKEYWIMAGLTAAGVLTTLGLGISNSIDQDDAQEKQETFQKRQTGFDGRLTESQEKIASLAALGTAARISWSVDNPTNLRQLIIENRSDGPLHNGLILLRATRSPTSRVEQYMNVGSLPHCERVKFAIRDGWQVLIKNINKGTFVFQLDSGFWSRPYPAGLVFLKSPPPDASETATDISRWATRKQDKIRGCT
ncbi:hypothetical protein [Streptomyces sp. NPDC048637]|uniref:hypothetical protein n=1 Tax=Streptomyces sp. NPDC048637 TaxID=3155636 RepID=UPI00342D164B